jgi:hypothetical protein
MEDFMSLEAERAAYEESKAAQALYEKQLWKAAPDLLAACKAALEYIEYDSEQLRVISGKPEQEVITQLQQAIKKARE